MNNKLHENNIKLRYLACVIPALFIAACNSGSSTPSTPGPTPTPSPSPSPTPTPAESLVIFVTESTYQGDMGYSAGVTLESGFPGANYDCLWDANNPLGPGKGRWKALLAGNGATQSGLSYYNLESQLIAVATESNLVGGISGLNVLESAIGVGFAWTGPIVTTLNTLYLNPLKASCSGWHKASSSLAGGLYGHANAVIQTTPGKPGTLPSNHSGWALNGIVACSDTGRHLYCVQQQ